MRFDHTSYQKSKLLSVLHSPLQLLGVLRGEWDFCVTQFSSTAGSSSETCSHRVPAPHAHSPWLWAGQRPRLLVLREGPGEHWGRKQTTTFPSSPSCRNISELEDVWRNVTWFTRSLWKIWDVSSHSNDSGLLTSTGRQVGMQAQQ